MEDKEKIVAKLETFVGRKGRRGGGGSIKEKYYIIVIIYKL